jgi:hypothetical protein
MLFEIFCMAYCPAQPGVGLWRVSLVLGLLPIWGFFSALPGRGASGPLASVFGDGEQLGGWLHRGVIFAVLSYLFYFIAVACCLARLVIGGCELLTAIGLDFGFWSG